MITIMSGSQLCIFTRVRSTPSRRLQRLIAATLISFSFMAVAQSVQEHVHGHGHGHGHDVMPFDRARTLHIFHALRGDRTA